MASSSNQWVRSVSFNKNNERDKQRLKFIGKKSFSKLVKKLIDEEMKRKNEEVLLVSKDENTNSTTSKKKVKNHYDNSLVVTKQELQQPWKP